MSGILLTQPPAWVTQPYAGLRFDFDFLNGRYWQRGYVIEDNRLISVLSRSSVGWSRTQDGTYVSFGSGVLRRTDGLGAIIEPAATNVVRHCRDLTQATWTKTLATAAKDQVGVDGVSNSASSLTALADNATATTTTTVGSSTRWLSMFVKRLIGSGAIEMTMDNGATWTPVTVTGSWTRVTVPGQTLANPTCGIRIVTSGDSIAVDFVQNETSAQYYTSPIETAGSSATRSAEQLFARSFQAAIAGPEVTVFFEGTYSLPTTTLFFQFGLCIDDGTTSNRIQMSRSSVTGHASISLTKGGVGAGGVAPSVVFEQDAVARYAISFKNGDILCSANGLTGSTGNGDPPFGAQLPNFRFGASQAGSSTMTGFARRVSVWSVALTQSQIDALTAL